MSEFTHINEQGHAKMVDISEKEPTVRKATACSSVEVTEAIYQAIVQGQIKKGDVLSVAQVAGIMAAKKTSEIIPMCHPIFLTGVDIRYEWETEPYILKIYVDVKTKGATGVEMEALTAASTTALTVYDMCKSMAKSMVIGPTYLLEKSGGKSGDFHRGSK